MMAGVARLATLAMGTRFEAIVLDPDERRANAAGEEALREIEHWHARLSLFDRSSFLSFINANAHARPVALDADLDDLLALCSDVWERSGGAFDPTIAPEMRRAGLHDRPDDGSSRIGFDAISLGDAPRTIRFTRPGVALDLGGVAKGFALDRAAGILRDCGVAGAFIHGGTSSGVCFGSPPPELGTSWAVALGAGPADPTLRFISGAFSVSAPVGRVVDGVHHILDPRGRRRIPLDRSAAVWTDDRRPDAPQPNAALCDAWSTALVVLGGRPASMPESLRSAVRNSSAWAFDPTASEVTVVPPRRTAGAA